MPNNSNTKFSIGTDPEFFLKKNGKYISAIPIIPGTKEAPHILADGAGLQWDNVAMEFASVPASDANSFVSSIRGTLSNIKAYLTDGITIDCSASADFPPEEINCDEAKQFGCSPDYNAWELVVNNPPEPKTPTFRSCGGHVHVGYTEGSPFTFLLEPMGKVDVVKAMDIILGFTSLILDNNLASIERRSLYGKAGAHRPTEYGCEYRTLSNYWLKSPLLVALTHSLVQDALLLVKSGKLGETIATFGEDFIKDSINGTISNFNPKIYKNKIDPYLSSNSLFLFDVALTKQFESLDAEWGIA